MVGSRSFVWSDHSTDQVLDKGSRGGYFSIPSPSAVSTSSSFLSSKFTTPFSKHGQAMHDWFPSPLRFL